MNAPICSECHGTCYVNVQAETVQIAGTTLPGFSYREVCESCGGLGVDLSAGTTNRRFLKVQRPLRGDASFNS